MRTAGAIDHVVPSPGTPTGGVLKYVVSEVLVTNAATGAYGGGAAVTGTFRLDIPSAKLLTAVCVGYRLATGESNPLPASGATAWNLTLDAYQQTQDGIWVPGNNIVTARPLPTIYESITGVRQWRGTVTVPNAPGTGIAAGLLYVIASWEAAAGAVVPDEQLRRLFEACKLTVSATSSSGTGL